jgi:hypothetical protein
MRCSMPADGDQHGPGNLKLERVPSRPVSSTPAARHAKPHRHREGRDPVGGSPVSSWVGTLGMAPRVLLLAGRAAPAPALAGHGASAQSSCLLSSCRSHLYDPSSLQHSKRFGLFSKSVIDIIIEDLGPRASTAGRTSFLPTNAASISRLPIHSSISNATAQNHC